MTMKKSEVNKIQKIARKLMDIDSRIWDKNKWQSGGDVNNEIYKKDLKKIFKKRKLDGIYYDILEDANFHTLNKMLSEEGYFKSLGNQEKYDEYRKAGGRTWNL